MSDDGEPGRLRRAAAWVVDSVKNGPNDASTIREFVASTWLWWRVWLGCAALAAPLYLGLYTGVNYDWQLAVAATHLTAVASGAFVQQFWRVE